MNIEIVGIADIDRIWAQVAEDVSRCLRKASMEIGAGDIWTRCRSGDWLLIIAHDGEKIHGTTVWRFTSHGFFECVLTVGRRLKSWAQPMADTATNIAKAHGCRGLIASGREGLIVPVKTVCRNARSVRVTLISEF